MTIPAQTEDPQAYQPSAMQLERAASLRRFNQVVVYLPFGLAALVLLAIIGLLLWGVFSPNIVGTRAFASALADMIVILTIIPLLLLCAVVPLAAVGFVVYRRRQPKREHGRIQTLFWRLDTLVDKANVKADALLSRTAHSVISGHALMTYWRTLLNKLKNMIIRR